MINNATLVREIVKSKQQGLITPSLANMMMELVTKLAKRPNFFYYTYREDMEAEGLAALVRGYDKFDETRFSNGHAFLTTVAWNGFMKFMRQEKKAQGIRDDMMVGLGFMPSHGAQAAYAAEWAEDQHGGNPPPSEGIRLKPRPGRPTPAVRQSQEDRLRKAERVLIDGERWPEDSLDA